MKSILITGGTGFIGQALVSQFLSCGYKVSILSRSSQKVDKIFGAKVSPVSMDNISGKQFDVVINLAGAGILDKPWTQSRIQEIFDSRVAYSVRLFQALSQCEVKPQLLLNASAIGYYGFWQDEWLDEDSSFHDGTVHQLCSSWEQVARSSQIEKVCCLRFGVVLGKGGGALQRMLLPFKLGLGGPIASGQQWFSWIHKNDVINIIDKIIKEEFFFETLNLTSPHPVRQSEFAKTFAKVLHRPAFIKTPQWALNLVFREGADLLTKSQRVRSSKLEGVGYEFIYGNLKDALEEVVS